MAKKLGTIKSISGSAEVIAVDKSGNQRVLKVGDSLYEGETVKTTSADSKVVIATNNGKELSMIGEDTLSLDPKATAGDSQVAALQKALLNGANLEDLEETAAGGNSGGRGDGMSLGETRFEHGGHYSNISASTSAINPLGAASFAGPVEGKSGGLDSGRGGNDDDTAGAGTTIDPETTRKPSNPEIKFPEDTNKDGKISDDENKAGDKDAGKTTVEVTIPKDGSVKPGDKVVVTDDNGKKTEKPINQDDIDKGKIDIPVDLNPGKDNNVTAEIINPNNPNNPGKDSKVIGEDSENTKVPEAPVINEIIDDAKGYGEDTKVGNVLDVKGHLTNDKTPTIKGTAKAGSKVEIYDNGDRIGETTAKADGSWEFTAPELTKQGEHKFTATAENKFGKSTPSNEATIDLDSIAPKLDNVKITPIDTNSRADDTAELTMGTGHTDTPNAEILFRDADNNIIGKGHANGAGDFLIQLDKAVQPGTPVFVQAIDKAGNAGTDMATAGNIEHPNDHTVPKVDIDTVTPVDETNPSDGTPDKGIVKGKSDEPNAPVVVTDENGKTIGTGTTDDKGNFEITTDPIKPGDKVKVEVTDKAGNKGSDTETAGDTEILHKDLPEAPVINEVIDDAKGYGEDTKVGNVLDVKGHLTNDKTPTIKGTAKAGSKVEIYDNGDRIGETTAKADGSWEFTAPELTKQGEHKFTATAENKFGKSTPSNEATIDLDSIAPKLDNVKITPIDTNSRADDTAELTMGTGHTDTPNAEILFRDADNNIIGKGHANGAGDFLIQLDKAVQPGTPVFVQAIDKAGNAGTDMATAGNIEHPNDHTVPKVDIDTVTPVDETNPSDGTPDKGIVKGKSDEPNAPVVVTDENGKTIGTGTTDDKGNFEITTDPIKPGDKVKVEVTDKAGNKGSDTETAGDTEFVDNTPPSVDVKEVTPVDTNNPADGNPDKGIVKGHSDEPNAPVVVKDKDGKTIGTGTTDDKGNFEITTTPIKPGDKVKVEVTDKAGNKGNGEGTAGNTDFTDKTAPDAPVITEVIDDVKGGKFNEDVKGGTTNDTTPTFKGTAEAGSTITLKNSNNIIAEKIPVKADGSWEFTPKSPLAEGEYNITATATDKAGNVSNASNVATVTIDLHTSKPVINEIIDNVEGDTGNVKNERIGWTNDNTPTLKGSAEAGATVDVYVDGRKAGSVKANEKGEWEYTTSKLSDGKHSFYAIATDEAGNVSENSGISWIKVDTNPGEVVITRITDDNGDDVLNGSYEGATKDNTPTIWGIGEQYATVTVSVKDSSGKVVWSDEVYIEDSLGDWHIDVPVALNDGDYTVEASMQDYVKNPVQNSNVVNLTIDNATDKPVIKEIIDDVEGDTGDISSKNNWTNDNTPTLKGSAEAGADIKVFVDGKIAGTTKAGFDGSWEFTPRTKLSDGDHTFYVEATDKIGNTNTSDIETIKVDTNPGKVVITSVTDDNGDDALNGAYEGATKDNTPTINGFAEPYSTVTVSVKDSSGKVVWSGEVYVEDSLGDWSITVDKPLNDGDYTVEASMQDYVKNPVQNSNVVNLTIDNATDKPVIKEIIDDVEGDTGDISSKNNWTNDNTPTLKGSAEAGADIKVFVDGKIAGTTKAGFDGSWEFTPRTKLGDGEHKFVVEATDKLGHSAKSIEASVDVDTTIGNPKVRFVEDTNNDGVLSVAEVAAIKDGKAHWVIDMPTDGSVKAGDVIQSIDGKGNWVKFVEITDEMIKDGRFEATFNVDINKLKDGKYETPEYRFADEAGNVSDSSKATLTLDSEFSRKPSNPSITFPEDTNKDGKISDDENKAGDKDAGKTTVEVTIPKDGSVKPGDKVVVTDDNGKKTEKPINQDDIDKGKIDIPVDLNPGKDNNVTAEIINPNNPNNPGKDSKVIGEASNTVKVTIDEIIDDVTGGVVNGDVKNGLTNDNLPTFKGSAAPGATVEIYESFYTTTEKTLVGKTVANANGKWSFTPTEAMGDGEHYFEAVATDKVGNKSTSDRVSLDVDTFADAPVIDAVNDNVDSQTGNVLDAKTKVALTNDSTPTLEGYAEPDSVITIYEISELNGDKTAIGTVTADNHGGWKFELPELGDGEYKYTTRAQDKAGNISDFSEEVVVNADLIAPSEPTITFVEDVNPKDGKLNKAENSKDGDSTSTKAQISVPGDAEENDVIHYTVNGEEKTHTITYNDRVTGYVEIKVPVVDGKASSVTAKIIDQAGNASKEVSGSIDSDFTAPNVKIIGIIDNVEGGVYKGNVAGTNTNDNKPTIKGTADANQEVVLYDNNKEFGRATADKDGNWEFKPSDYKEPLADLVGRVHVIKAVVTDAAGNTSEATSALEVDTTIGAPKVSIKEDADHNGVLSVEEAKNLKDSKIHWEVEIPKDGTVSAGDVLQVLGKDGKWKTEKVLSNDDLGKSFEYEATLSGKHFESPSYRIVDLVGNQSTAIHANVQLDSEFSRKPSNPSITFPEDTNKDGKISDDENKAGDKDAGKTTVEVTIPKDGSVKPGDKVVVTDDNGKKTEKPINQDDIDKGKIDIPVDLNPGKDNNVTAEIINPNNPNNPGKDSKGIGEDSENTKAPEAPVITEVIDDQRGGKFNEDVKGGLTNDSTPTFKGTAKPGTTITLKNGNDVIADNIPVKTDGSWEFTIKTPLAQGDYSITATAKNAAGKVSAPSDAATIKIDLHSDEPVITEIIDNVAGGVVNGDVKGGLTNDNTPTLKGTAEPFATVEIKIDGRGSYRFENGEVISNWTAVADKDGNWEFTTPKLSDGHHNFEAQATDVAGNNSQPSALVSIDVDTTIGVPTVKITTDTNSDKKIDITDASALKDGKLKWVIDIPENTVKAGDRVQILGSDAQTWTDIFKVTAQDIAKGFIERDEFSIDMPKSRGFQTPSYRLVDDAGNVSEGSMDAVKIVGFAPKAPTIIAVLDNEYGIDPKDPISINAGDTTGNVLEGVIAITNDNTPTLMGKAEAGTTITLKKGNTVIADNIPVDANGSWHYEPEENSPWADGDYKITAIAKNIFGKESESSSPITVTVDTTGPEVTLTSIEDSVKTNDVVDFTGNVKDKVTNDNTPLLKGTAEAGSVIIIKYGEHHENEVTTKADKNGHWEYKITNPLSDGEHIISYQAVDKAGNTSLEYVANVTVDTKIADAKVEFIEDTNNDGKFSWKENIENPNIGRMAWKALIPDDGSIKAGDTFNYRWGASDSWHNRTITQADIDRGYIGEKVQNQYEQGQPNAGKPLAFGANANGRVYEAEAYFSDAAGNKGKAGSDKVVFDFSDNTDNKHIATTNVKITSIYDDVRGGHVGNLITNEAAQVAGLTNDKTPTISGTAEANASVKVSVVDSKSHSVWEKTITAESDGSWKVTTDDIADGNYSVTAVATNKAGAVSNPYTVSNLEIDTTIAQPNIWIKEDANQDKIYDKADYENPANGNGDITFVVDIPQDRVTIKAGDVFHYMINTNNPKWGNINGYTEDITITEADIKSGSISRVVTLCDDGKDFNMSHNGMIVSMNGQFKDLAGNALSNDTMVRFDLKNTYGGKVRSARSLPDDILDNDSVDLSNAAHINEPKAEPNVLNNNKIGVSSNDLLEAPKDHIMNEGKSEAKPSYATASSHAGEENIATTHPIQIEEKVESHF